MDKSAQYNSLYKVSRALYMKDKQLYPQNKFIREAKVAIKKMPDDMDMTDKSYAFQRAFNVSNGDSCASVYTVEELREAVVKNLLHHWSYSYIRSK